MYLKFKDIVENLNLTINGVIHVGGHIGEEVPDYLEYTSNIHIFEPLKWCYDRIPNNVTKYNYALGDVAGTQKINVAINNQSSSLLKPKTHLTRHPDVTFHDGIDIEVRTLDSFDIKTCNFLNMDVQGYELNVLKGGIETLKCITAIYTEVNMEEVYENNCLISELDSWLKNYSFDRIWVYDTGCGWGDALYVRTF